MRRGFLFGLLCGLGAQPLLRRLILLRFERTLASLNAGDYGPLLNQYADDAVLRFNDGGHRWAGEHRGKPAIERFMQDFTAAGLHGRLRGLWIAGPPWALTMAIRFDDEASAPDGQTLYENRVAMVLRTRWGKVLEHDDFYADTSRIEAFEQALNARGIHPVAEPAAA